MSALAWAQLATVLLTVVVVGLSVKDAREARKYAAIAEQCRINAEAAADRAERRLAEFRAGLGFNDPPGPVADAARSTVYRPGQGGGAK